MIRRFKTQIWALVYISLFLAFALATPAQRATGTPSPPDTALNPHDFTNEFYAENGIKAKEIIGRRTGTDLLSVFSWSSDPNHTEVRVIATIPGYNQFGSPVFWYPLGEVDYWGFTDDILGISARQMAQQNPIYVFPDRWTEDQNWFSSGRQAPLFDNPLLWGPRVMNPVGVRQLRPVYYTEKALGQEGEEMMLYLKKKNGIASDDTAMIRTREDIQYLLDNEFIRFHNLWRNVKRPDIDHYVLSPIIADPTNGVIAHDAFILMPTVGGIVLPSETIFTEQFACLKKLRDWCFN